MSESLDPNRLVEAYNLNTGAVAQIPAAWIGDPVLGREWAKTPAQAAYDGDLPERPTNESTVKEIDKYADVAGIDLTGASTKDEKLVAIDGVFARHGAAQTAQAGMTPVELPPIPEGAPLGVTQPAPDVPDPAADVEPVTEPTDPADPAATTKES